MRINGKQWREDDMMCSVSVNSSYDCNVATLCLVGKKRVKKPASMTENFFPPRFSVMVTESYRMDTAINLVTAE